MGGGGEGGGSFQSLLKMTAPTRAVRGANRRGHRCQLAQIALSPPAPTVGPSEPTCQRTVYVPAPTCQCLCDTLFVMCCEGDLGGGEELCLQESWIAVLLTSPASNLPPHPPCLHSSDGFIFRVSCRGIKEHQFTMSSQG